MENPNPPIQRRRRSDRYKIPDGQALPPSAVPAASPRPAALSPAAPIAQPVPPPAPLRTPPAARPQDAPPVMERAYRKGTPRAAEKPGYRMPWQLTAAITGLFLLILALLAAQNLMAAYLTNRQAEREAAYQKVVDGHPVYFTDLIAQYAAEYNLQPGFVTAIILNESSFRTDAESGVGARGLMQLMPDTAQWIAGKLDVSGYSFDRMYDAESNIRFGSWYLNYLSKLFRGDPVAVACAYHAGQSTVASWLSDRSISPDGVSLPLENLPDGPTKTYAGRVTRDYGIYDALVYHVFNPSAPLDGAADGDPAADIGAAR